MSIEVGQTVWVKKNRTPGLTECKVTKVGRKYFEIDAPGWTRDKFEIRTLRHVSNYLPAGYVCLNKEDYENNIKADQLRTFFREIFSGYTHVNLTLDQLLRMEQITKENL